MNIMLDWVKASYKVNSMQPKALVTTLTYVESEGNYNIYEIDMSDDSKLVIFSDQKALLDYVNLNLGSVFMLGFLKEDNRFHEYPYKIDGITYSVLTLARATVLVQGSLDRPRILGHDYNGTIVIE